MRTTPLATFNMIDGFSPTDERYDITRETDDCYRVDNYRQLRNIGTLDLTQSTFSTFGEAIAYVLEQTGWGETTISIATEMIS